MSELKTNKISTNDQNNVAIDDALGLKSYTTTQRDALTSVLEELTHTEVVVEQVDIGYHLTEIYLVHQAVMKKKHLLLFLQTIQ